jgi:CBS domain-containing protein
MRYENTGALIKDQQTIRLGPQATIQEAAEQMAAHRIGAIAVVVSGELKGIFTERDLLNRVVAKGLQPTDVCLEEVMTRNPITVASDTSLVESLGVMFEHKFRHLPVVDEGQVVGVMSCRDIPTDYRVMWERWMAARNERKTAAAG